MTHPPMCCRDHHWKCDHTFLVCPSVGSIGHPHSCKQACKFFSKLGGCRGGRMCTCCHICLWSRNQAKIRTKMPWDPHHDAPSENQPSAAAVHTSDPPVVLYPLHGDRDDDLRYQSAAKTPLQVGDGIQRPAEMMANKLSKKLQRLQLHQGVDLQPSTRDDSGPCSDSCWTPETTGMFNSALLPYPMKLPVPPLRTPPEMQAVQGPFASVENVQDEGFTPPPPLPDGKLSRERQLLPDGNSTRGPGQDVWPSVGSVGHPHACAGLGCKFFNKARGCKDGQLCTRCHLCRWNRYDKSWNNQVATSAPFQDWGIEFSKDSAFKTVAFKTFTRAENCNA